MRLSWVEIGAISTLLLFGCGSKYENHVRVATCEGGDIFVKEIVDTNTWPRGGVFTKFSLYFKSPDKVENIEIAVTSDSVYKLATPTEHLKEFQQPQFQDWRLFISPSTISLEGYERVASCIQNNMQGIYEKMSESRSPSWHFPSRDRVLPQIATIRYADLNQYRKAYECPDDRELIILESGVIHIRRQGTSLLGVLFNDGRSIAFREKSIHSETRNATDPNTYLGLCKDEAGRSILHTFDVSFVNDDKLFFAMIDDAKRHEWLREIVSDNVQAIRH